MQLITTTLRRRNATGNAAPLNSILDTQHRKKGAMPHCSNSTEQRKKNIPTHIEWLAPLGYNQWGGRILQTERSKTIGKNTRPYSHFPKNSELYTHLKNKKEEGTSMNFGLPSKPNSTPASPPITICTFKNKKIEEWKLQKKTKILLQHSCTSTNKNQTTKCGSISLR